MKTPYMSRKRKTNEDMDSEVVSSLKKIKGKETSFDDESMDYTLDRYPKVFFELFHIKELKRFSSQKYKC